MRHALGDCHHFFDTGVINNIMHRRNEKSMQRMFSDLAKLNYVRNEAPFFIASALQACELLGITPSIFDPLLGRNGLVKKEILSSIKTLNEENCSAVLKRVFDSMKAYVENCECFSTEHLYRIIEREKNYKTSSGFSLLCLASQPLFDGRANAFDSLAFDRISAIPYEHLVKSERCLDKVVTELMAYVYTQCVERSGHFATSRISDLALRRAVKVLANREISELYPSNDQNVDTLIMELLIFGHKAALRGNKRVLVVTTEKIAGWSERLQRAAAVVDFLDDLHVKKTGERIVINPGILLRVLPTGEICRDQIDLEIHPRFQRFELLRNQWLKKQK